MLIKQKNSFTHYALLFLLTVSITNFIHADDTLNMGLTGAAIGGIAGGRTGAIAGLGTGLAVGAISDSARRNDRRRRSRSTDFYDEISSLRQENKDLVQENKSLSREIRRLEQRVAQLEGENERLRSSSSKKRSSNYKNKKNNAAANKIYEQEVAQEEMANE